MDPSVTRPKGSDVIQVEHARKVFNGFEAVSDVSFTVPESSFTTLLGASGSGKTTLLRLLAGLERLDGGSISIRSTPVASTKPFLHVPPEGRRVGFVFQTYALWPHMTVFDQVAYPLKVRRQRVGIREKVDAALALVDLSGLGGRYPSELSGGQQQRVALARALVYEPTVLLLDEPLSNLDAELREYMRNELQALHRRLRVTMVYVTHDQSEALSLSDQVILMHKGRIIDRGAPRAIYERPGNFETSRFVGASNVFRGVVDASAGPDLGVTLECGVSVRLDRARLLHPVAQGDRVAVSIKPEDVVIASAGRRGANHYQVRVESVAYVGPHQDATLDLNGSRLRVRAPKALELQLGALVDVEWPPEMVGVFAVGAEPDPSISPAPASTSP